MKQKIEAVITNAQVQTGQRIQLAESGKMIGQTIKSHTGRALKKMFIGFQKSRQTLSVVIAGCDDLLAEKS